MSDEHKSKEQLISDLATVRESLRQCTIELHERNQDLDDVARYVVSELRSPLGTNISFAELLEEDYPMLSEGERRYCVRTIRRSGRKMARMVNALLLLANSRRLFDNVWYAAYLATLGETSLAEWALEGEEPVSEAYRFTCLPASSAPVVIRVWRTGSEPPRFQAVAKFDSVREGPEGATGLAPQETAWMLAAKEWDSLAAALGESKFWTASLEELSWLRMVGGGGEEWILEGWHDGQYKARAVWNPDEQKGPDTYELGRLFIGLLPGPFALEMARYWGAHSPHMTDDLLGEGLDLRVVD